MVFWRKNKPAGSPPASPAAAPGSDEASGVEGPAGALDPAEAARLADPTRIFGEVVSLLAREPAFSAYSFEDMAWLVAPAVEARQALVARARGAGLGTAPKAAAPVGALLWASVSDRLDAELRGAGGALEALKPHRGAWRGGERVWLAVALGPEAVQARLQNHLRSRLAPGARFERLNPRGARTRPGSTGVSG